MEELITHKKLLFLHLNTHHFITKIWTYATHSYDINIKELKKNNLV